MTTTRSRRLLRAVLICFIAATLVSYPIKSSQALCKPAVYCGPNDSFALKEDGTVWAWGNNNLGQLGDGSCSDRSTPVQVKNLKNIKSLACRYMFTYALDEQGILYGWGKEGYGSKTIQRPGSTSGNYLNDEPSPLDNWERNDYSSPTIQQNLQRSEFANGYDVDHPIRLNIPIKIGVIACNFNHFCSYELKGKAMAVDSLQNTRLETMNLPGETAGFKSILPCSQVDGTRSWLALDSDGQVWFKKNPSYGFIKVEGLNNVLDIAADLHYAALKSDGTVWIWGNNNYGQLGDGTLVSSETPRKVNGISGITQIAVAGGHSLALKQDGTVWAWGLCGVSKTRTGEENKGIFVKVTPNTLDCNPSPPESRKVLTPTLVPGISNVTYVSAGVYHCMAIKADGSVWAWGYNDFGQLGNGTKVNSETPVMVKDLNVRVPFPGTKVN